MMYSSAKAADYPDKLDSMVESTDLVSTSASMTGMMHSLRTLKKSLYLPAVSKNCITTVEWGKADILDRTSANNISPWGVSGNIE